MSTYRCGKLIVVSAILLIVGQAATARYWLLPESTFLRYRLKEGDRLRYAIERKSVTALKLGDAKDRTTTVHQVLDILQTINEGKEGVATVSFKIERLRFTIEREGIAGGNVQFDSRDKQFKNVEGMTITARLDTLGQLSDVKVPPQLLTLLRGIGKAVDVSLEETWQLMLMQCFPVLPAEAVTKGKTWSHQVVSPRKTGAWRVDHAFTYHGVETTPGREKLAVLPTLTIELKKGLPAPPDKKIRNSGDGVVYFDSHSGRVIEMALSQSYEMAYKLKDREARQRVQQSLSVKLLEAK